MAACRGAGHVRQALMGSLLILAAITVRTADGHASEDDVMALETVLVRQAASRIDDALGTVADSTRALGDTYARLTAAQEPDAQADTQDWMALRKTKGSTTELRTWQSTRETPPAFQASFPGLYSYNGPELSPTIRHQLNTLEALAPTIRSAYESLPYSWVYMTTADKVMLIYPYVPIDEAVNNDDPTKTPFYRAANLADRSVGWTSPYLDLVGAGMMITASYPVYTGDTLQGVMSRDMTLNELTTAILSPLHDIVGGTALLVDDRGLAIGASDPVLAAEIDRVNTGAGDAVLHYRTAKGLESLAAKGVSSASIPANSAVELVIARNQDGSDFVRTEVNGKPVLAAPIKRTGWILVLILPAAA